MADEFKTRFTIEADEAIRLLKSLADAEDRLARETENLGRKSREQSKENENATKIFGMLRGEIMSLIGAMTGGLGLIEIWNSYKQSIEAANRALQENAKLTRAAAEARLDLASLRGYENPEDIAFINQAAAFAGRSQGEVARTMTTIGGAIGADNTAGIQGLTMQIAAKAQQTTASMEELANPFIQIFNRTQDARVSANILEGAIDAAVEPNPANVGKTVGALLGLQSDTGLGVGQSAGVAAALSGLGLQSTEVATTSFRNTALALRGKGTTEGNEILDREGIDRNDLLLGVKQMLAAIREGRISRQEVESIAGKEGMAFIGAMTDPKIGDEFFNRVAAVGSAESAPGLFLSQKSKGIFGSDSQRFNLMAKQMEASTAGVKGTDDRAARVAAAQSAVEATLTKAVREGMVSQADADRKLEQFKYFVASGVDPVDAAEKVESSSTLMSSIGMIFSGNRRIGPELGATVFDFLEMGPNLDPSTQREIGLFPASGHPTAGSRGSRPTSRAELSSAPTIIQTIINNSVVNSSDPAKDASPAQTQP